MFPSCSQIFGKELSRLPGCSDQGANLGTDLRRSWSFDRDNFHLSAGYAAIYAPCPVTPITHDFPARSVLTLGRRSGTGVCRESAVSCRELRHALQCRSPVKARRVGLLAVDTAESIFPRERRLPMAVGPGGNNRRLMRPPPLRYSQIGRTPRHI
jgi:hypothetical protein